MLSRDALERAVIEVDLDLGPCIEPERACPDVVAEVIQLLRREDTTTACLTTRDALELAQLLEGVDAHVRVRADAERDRALPRALGRQEAVTKIGLRRRADTDRRARRGEEVELGPICMCRMHHSRALGQTAGPSEQLDGAAAVLG